MAAIAIWAPAWSWRRRAPVASPLSPRFEIVTSPGSPPSESRTFAKSAAIPATLWPVLSASKTTLTLSAPLQFPINSEPVCSTLANNRFKTSSPAVPPCPTWHSSSFCRRRLVVPSPPVRDADCNSSQAALLFFAFFFFPWHPLHKLQLTIAFPEEALAARRRRLSKDRLAVLAALLDCASSVESVSGCSMAALFRSPTHPEVV